MDRPNKRDESASIDRQSDVITIDPAGTDDGFVQDTDLGIGRAMALQSGALEGQRIGRFTVLGAVGRGGMGIVLRAYDETLARMVALKLLNGRFAGPQQQRLLREGQALAQLSHPNVVQVYEMGMVGDQMFIAMELVVGASFRAWQQEPHPWREVLDVYLQAGRGLAAAHAQGLIHRDFKPENCILGVDGRVRVLDFGLARAVKLDESGEAPPQAEGPEESIERRLTLSGAVLGTTLYLPLQQFSGQPATDKTDQYSFSVSLYEGLYGKRPFAEGSLPELLAALETETFVPISGSSVPTRVRQVLLRGLAREPEDRWPSMNALLAELERVRRPRRAWLVVGSAAVMGVAWLAFPAEDPCQAAVDGLGDIWGPQDRGAVRSAFTRRRDPEAARLLERVEAHLDGSHEAWATMADTSCRSTFVERTQSEELFDRRRQCLVRHRNRLRSTVDSLAEIETSQQLTERSILAFKLPSLDACADVNALMARAPPPEDPAAREQIDALRFEIDRANTMLEAGELTRGIELAEVIVADARLIDYPPVLAEALGSLGQLQAHDGFGHEAEATLYEAIDVAARAKADGVAARAWALLIHALLSQGELERAVTLEHAAEAAVDRADDEIARGWLLNSLGAVYADRGDLARSHRYLREALRVKQHALGPDHVDVGIAWANLGKALHDSGDHDEALLAFEQAQATFVATVGQSHPYAAFVEMGLGDVLRDQGKLAEAAEHYRQALTVRVAMSGPEDPQASQSLRALGEVEVELGRLGRLGMELSTAGPR